jgi:hypothetical protein
MLLSEQAVSKHIIITLTLQSIPASLLLTPQGPASTFNAQWLAGHSPRHPQRPPFVEGRIATARTAPVLADVSPHVWSNIRPTH